MTEAEILKELKTIVQDYELLQGLRNIVDNYNPNQKRVPKGQPNGGQFMKENKIIPIKINKDSVPVFDSTTELKNWIADNLDLLGTVKIKSSNQQVLFSRSNVGRSMKGISRRPINREIYAALKEIVETSQPLPFRETDERHLDKAEYQEVYYNEFIYDNQPYSIKIFIDIPKNEIKKLYPDAPNTYAGHKIKEI